MSEVANLLEQDLDAITQNLGTMFSDRIPEFRHDEVVRRVMHASVASNLSSIFSLLRFELTDEEVAVPQAAAEYARRFAQLDLPAEALLRAYRLGEQGVLQLALDALPSMNLDAEASLSTVALIASRVNLYIDTVIAGIQDIYEDEHRRWLERDDAARRTRVIELLSRRDLDDQEADDLLGLPSGCWHTAAIAWVAIGANESGARRLRSATVAVAASTGSTPSFVTVDDETLWLWLSDTNPLSIDRNVLTNALDGEDVRVAFGEPGYGLSGFRSSFREAERTRAVALESRRIAGARSAPGAAAWHHDEVALSGLVSPDFEGARQWSARVLGLLSSDDEATSRLRATARAYLSSGRSHATAASQLEIHRNTVAYRINRIEELLGHTLDHRRLDIEVALEFHHQFGRNQPHVDQDD